MDGMCKSWRMRGISYIAWCVGSAKVMRYWLHVYISYVIIEIHSQFSNIFMRLLPIE
jgi:hypothetical protein